MKNVILFFLFLSLASCQQQNEDSREINRKQDTLNKLLKSSIDLFDKNAPIPVECYTNAGVAKEFSVFKGYVNACVDIMLDDENLISFHDSKKCISNIGEKFRKISSQDCKDTMLTASPGNLEELNQFLLDGYFDKYLLTYTGGDFDFNWTNGLDQDNPNYESYVTNYFSLVAEWQHQTRGQLYKLNPNQLVFSPSQEKFLEEKILRKFWNAVQSYSAEWKSTFGQITTANSASPQQEKLFQVFEAILSINSKVITHAYESDLAKNEYFWRNDDTVKKPSPVLAVILGDTIAPFYERIRTITKIYDIGCKIKSCYDNFYDNNQTVWMLHFFNDIASGRPIKGFDFDQAEQTPLISFLSSMNSEEELISTLINKTSETFGVSRIDLIEPGLDFPFTLKNFHAVFAESHSLIAKYNETKRYDSAGELRAGFFHGGDVSEVNIGFSKLNMDRHISEVTNVNDQLRSLSDSFKVNHNSLIAQTLNVNQSQVELTQLEGNITRETTELVNLQNQVSSIRNFINDRRKQYSNKILGIISDLDSSTETFVKVGATMTETIDASSSDMGTGTMSDIGKSLVTFPEPLVKGDLIRFNVEGEYQASCAAVANYGPSVVSTRSGPRGLNLNFSTGRAQVQSNEKYKYSESFSSVSVDAETCGGISDPLGGTFFSAKACVRASVGRRSGSGSRTSTMNSTSTRSESTFDLGLTLEQSPFPSSPISSLLLVEMPIDSDTGLQDNSKDNAVLVKTLDRSSSVIAKYNDTQSNYYFVVNDCYSPTNKDQLTVSITQYRAAGALANSFVTKVLAIMPKIESQVRELIKNGVLSEGTLSTLRSEIVGSATGGISLDSFNGNIRTLLEAFVSNEIDILRYKSQVSSLERQIDFRKLKLESLLETFDESNEQRYLKISQRNWNLANMDLDFVNTEGTNRNLFTLNRVINILEHSLVSYLDFKYDEERKYALVGNINLLTNLDFSSPFDEIALNVNSFMDNLLTALRDDLRNNPITPKVSMGIHIPNPYYIPPAGFPTPLYEFPIMDDFRSKKIWNQLYKWKKGDNGATINFDILFKDLYSDNGLGCYVEAPIIDSTALFFIPENEGYISDFNKKFRNRNAKLYLDGLSFVPFGNNPREYRFVNRAWRFMDSGVRMATNSTDALERLSSEFPVNSTIESGLSTGRSPFGYFQLGDLPAYKYIENEDKVFIGNTPLDEIRELFIAYNFAASNNDFTVNLGWLSHCAQGSL
jgi:hypothetical protein